MADFIVTTTPNVEGYMIEKYCGIVGNDYFIFNSDNMQESLSDMIDRAKQLGANAIVGLNIVVWSDTSGFRGCDTRECNQAYGTAVRIREAYKQLE